MPNTIRIDHDGRRSPAYALGGLVFPGGHGERIEWTGNLALGYRWAPPSGEPSMACLPGPPSESHARVFVSTRAELPA